MKSNQEIIDEMETHLLKQGKQAISPEGNCQYRTKDNLACAIGCLIKDEFYNQNMESCTILCCNLISPLRKSGHIRYFEGGPNNSRQLYGALSQT